MFKLFFASILFLIACVATAAFGNPQKVSPLNALHLNVNVDGVSSYYWMRFNTNDSDIMISPNARMPITERFQMLYPLDETVRLIIEGEKLDSPWQPICEFDVLSTIGNPSVTYNVTPVPLSGSGVTCQFEIINDFTSEPTMLITIKDNRD